MRTEKPYLGAGYKGAYTLDQEEMLRISFI